MKKIALSLAVVATLAMVSCGNKAATEDTTAADTVDTTVAIAEEVVADSTDTAVAVAAEETVAPADEAAKADSPKAEEAK